MGALLASIFGSNELADVEVDWETVNPADSTLHNETAQLLERCQEMQNEIDNYKGAKTEISAAMAASLEECGPPTRVAFDVVAKNASICLGWMDTTNIISIHLKDHLLPHLKTTLNNDENKENDLTETSLLKHGSLFKQLINLFDFLLTFDQKKMVTSQIQNDFAFYKRTLSKTQESYMKGCEITVNSEKAGFISMFLAQANPLIREVSTQLKNDINLNVLAIFCNALLDLLKANKFSNNSTSNQIESKKAVRAMLVSFIIFDHATQNGAFHRRSGVKAHKVCVMIVREYEDLYGNKEDVSNLDNSLRYSTLHFADQTTPQSIKRLLAE